MNAMWRQPGYVGPSFSPRGGGASPSAGNSSSATPPLPIITTWPGPGAIDALAA